MGRHEVVVITGASAGVGRATVREFAKRGAWIGLIARGMDGLEGARREVEAAAEKHWCCVWMWPIQRKSRLLRSG
jgi:NADP-dependent 3-hydroxy acid dehydrogenase YdfG